MPTTAASRPQHGLLTRVARAAGVSVGTVSKVVHDRRDVSPATRARIRELLAEHGVELDGASRRRIITVFRDLASPYTLEMVRGLTEAAAEVDAEVVIGTTMTRSVSDWLAMCEQPEVAGVVLVISRLGDEDQQRVAQAHLPVVLVDPLSEPLPGVPTIGVSNWRGAREAVEHLLALGHTSVAMIAGRPHSPAGGARLQGYRAALHDAGIEPAPSMIRATDFDFEEAVRAATSLLTADPRPTAIFASSDAQALGVLEAARRCGVDVPGDLSVVSFDDTPTAAMAAPPLTAVHQPFEEIAQLAIRLIREIREGTHGTGVDRYEIATTLRVRSSTAPPSP